jgi:hypothetical protein
MFKICFFIEGFKMNIHSNTTAGVVVSIKVETPDWPVSPITGTIKDDRDGRIYKFNERTFKGWFEGMPLVNKRVRFFPSHGPDVGYMAIDVELE